MIPHIVLTRFNLAISFGCDKRFDTNVPTDKPWLDKGYLEQRFAVFEKYTFSSFYTQTDQDFKWIILFHEDTPIEYKERIRVLAEKMTQIEVWFLNDEQCKNFSAIINDYIAQKYHHMGVITTRVDNDDMVHKEFIASIKKDFEICNKAQILTYVNGLQYDSRNHELVKYFYVNNHFLSLYVPDSQGKNHILLYNHAEIDKDIEQNNLKKIEKETKMPLWIEVITETNFSNTLRWRFSAVLVPYSVREEYPILALKWNTRLQWVICGLLGLVKVVINRGKGFFRMIKSI